MSDIIDMTGIKVVPSAGGTSVPVIYVVDSPEHPLAEGLLEQGRTATLVTIPVAHWNDALTPWPAPGLYREEPDFGGHAERTLSELVTSVIPAVEAREGLSPTARAICGYSLGGLFALYALTHCDAFAACACLSGSVWYEGWVEHLRELPLNLAGRFVYLSLGTKERKAARPLLKTVQDRMEECARILQERGATVEYRTGPGKHMQHVPERFDAGLTALEGYLSPTNE